VVGKKGNKKKRPRRKGSKKNL